MKKWMGISPLKKRIANKRLIGIGKISQTGFIVNQIVTFRDCLLQCDVFSFNWAVDSSRVKFSCSWMNNINSLAWIVFIDILTQDESRPDGLRSVCDKTESFLRIVGWQHDSSLHHLHCILILCLVLFGSIYLPFSYSGFPQHCQVQWKAWIPFLQAADHPALNLKFFLRLGFL